MLSSAGKSNEEIKYLLRGDLEQMSIQEQFLFSKGLEMGRNDVYPGFKTKELYLEAIRIIWTNKVRGWWNYKRDLVDAGICTQKEFNALFERD